MTEAMYNYRLRQEIDKYPEAVVKAANEAIGLFDFDEDLNCTNEFTVIRDVASVLYEDHDILIDLDDFRKLIDMICTVGAAAVC